MTNYLAKILRENGATNSENGIKTDGLLILLGRPNIACERRKLTADIQYLRRNWNPKFEKPSSYILSTTSNGYYVSENIEEVARFVRRQRKRAIEAFKTISNVRKELKKRDVLGKGE